MREARGDHNKAAHASHGRGILDSQIYQNESPDLRLDTGRRWGLDGEIRDEMALPPTQRTARSGVHGRQFERLLLRHCLGALEEDRHRCVDCERSPLIGEHVHLYDGRAAGLVCELCRPLRRETPVASEIVRHSEHGHAVRLTARAA